MNPMRAAILFTIALIAALLAPIAAAQEKKPPSETDLFFKKAEPPRLKIVIAEVVK